MSRPGVSDPALNFANAPPVIAYAPELQLLSRSRRSFRHPRHHPINQPINHSINSWFLVLDLWCLGLGSYCFFDSPGAHMGVRQGGFQGDGLRPDHSRTTFQFRLKIAYVFDLVSL